MGSRLGRRAASLRALVVMSALAVGLTFPATASAGAPNDDFANATVITPASLPFTHSLDPSSPTFQATTPDTDCNGTQGDVWYRFTPSTTGSYRFDTLGSDLSTGVDLFRGTVLASLVVVDCTADINANDPDQWNSRITFRGIAGQRYYFRVELNGGIVGDQLTVHLASVTAPANDNYANATAIGSLPFVAAFNTSAASIEPNEPRFGFTDHCSGIGATRWFRYTPPVNQTVQIDTIGTDFDTVLGVYTGATAATATEVLCNDDTWYSDGNVYASRVTFKAKVNTTVRIQVGGFSGQNGPVNLRVRTVAAEPNDDFASAQPVTALPFRDWANLQKATRQGPESSPSCEDMFNTVWYSHMAVDTDTLQVIADGQGNAEGAVAVWTGNAFGSLTQIACTGSSTTFTPVAGTLYRFQVAAQGGRTAPIEFTLQDAP